ncbi:LamG domain-containing protein [Candidatus Pacearchaeota archaeon]|nr:LamG domain-containing protein [Candidatus Pacearchaeota archaeon]
MKRGGIGNSRIHECEERIKILQHQRKKFVGILQTLTQQYLNREISRAEYDQKTSERHEGKTCAEWIHYYDTAIHDCHETIAKARDVSRRNKIIAFTLLGFIMAVTFFYAFHGPTLTGFAVNEESAYIDIINQSLSSSTTYFWHPEHQGTLSSLRISGSVKGEGTVKIYLNDKLVYASEKKRSLITGSAIESPEDIPNEAEAPQQTTPLNEEPPLEGNQTEESLNETAENVSVNETTTTHDENVTDEFSYTFTNECQETCNLKDENLTDNTYNLKIELEGAVLTLDSISYTLISPKVKTGENASFDEFTQGPAEVGKPVTWTKDVHGKKNVTLPKEARNIKVSKNNQDIICEESESEESKDIACGEEDYEISYDTPAPTLTEESMSSTHKRITIQGPDSVHYKDVTASAKIEETVDASSIQLLWNVNDVQQAHPFTALDTNNDSLFDTIQWTVPHLSTQIFDIIIVTHAVHLDKNRKFISDIYDQIKAADGIWSDPIGNEEYVRITFARSLDATNDISIYPRIVSGDPIIEVSERDENTVIATFANIQNNTYNKVLLETLQGTQDTFDLKIINGTVQFDHIIDPPTGIVTLFFNNTMTSGSFPARAKKLGTGSPNAVNISWPGEFDANQVPVDASGIGQWFPIIGTIGNTTSTNAVNNASLSSRLNYSVGPGWLWDDNLTGYQISQGGFQFNVSLMGGQAAAIAAGERIFVRISIVNVTSNAFHVVRDLLATNCTGGTCSGGQNGWAPNEGPRINHPALNQIYTNITFNVTSNQSYTFHEGQWLYIELGFGDATSTTDRTIGLRYNIANTFVKTPRIYEATAPIVTLQTPADAATVDAATVGFNATFTDNSRLANVTLFIWNSTSLVNQTTRSLAGTTNNTNISVTLPRVDTYFWNYLASDNESNSAFASNFTLVYQAAGDTTPPLVTIGSPDNRTYIRLQGIPFDYNVSLNENGSVSYSLDGGIHNVSMLGNEGIFGTTFNDTNESLAEGTYIFTVYANDTAGNQNHTTQVFFSRADVNILLNSTVTDADGELINTTVQIIKSDGTTIYNQTNITHDDIIPVNDTYDIIIQPHGIDAIEQVVFADLNLSDYAGTQVNVISIDESNDSSETAGFDSIFALDPQIENFTEATVTINATANTIYKCVDWDYENRTCLGAWDLFLSDLVPGELYNFTLTPGDPGYGVINIINAQHLNASRDFISDIYTEVKDLDDVWSEDIQDTHYVRITFERNLSSRNDISIYPRVISGTPRIEVYEFNSTQVLGEFTTLDENTYNKFILSSLPGTQDTFDLKIINGTVQFDHITDPSTTFLVPNTGTAPGTNGTLSETTFTISQQSLTTDNSTTKLNRSDNYCLLGGVGTATLDSFVLVNFTLPSNMASVGQVFITTESNTSAANDVKDLGLFNWTSSAWVVVNSSKGAANIENVTTFNITKTLALNFVSSTGMVRVMVKGNGGSADSVCVDFISANVTYEAFPVANLYTPANGTTTGVADMGFNATFTDDTGVNNATLWIWNTTSLVNTTMRVLRGTTNNTNISVTLPRGGTYFWNYQVNDTVGNSSFNRTNFTLTYDNFPPIVTMDKPANITFNSFPILFNITTDENATCNYTLDNGANNKTLFNQTQRAFNATNASMADGNYIVTYYCWDIFNNFNGTASRGFGVDTVNPGLVINSPANNSNLTTSYWAILNWSVQDKSNSTEVWVYGTNDSNASYIYDYLIYHTKNNGNGSIMFNWSAPAIRATDNTTVLLLHFDNLSEQGENASVVNDFSPIQNNATVQNMLFNETGRIAGALTFNGVASAVNVSVNNSVDFIMPSYTIMAWIYIIGNGTNASTGGGGATIYPIISKGINESSESTTTDIQFYLGINSSSGTLQGGFENHTNAGAGGGQNSPIVGVTVLETYTWYQVALVVEEKKYESLYINGILEANTSILGLTPNGTRNTAKIGIGQAYNTSGAVVGAFNGTIDELVIFNKSLQGIDIANLYNLSNGLKYWAVNTSDSATNKNASARYIFNLATLDTTAPQVTIIEPTSKIYGSNSLQFNVSLTEPGTVLYSLDGGAKNYSMTGNNSNTGFNATNASIADGIYTFSAYANDTAGNNNYTVSVTFQVDAKKPDVNFTNPTPNNASSQSGNSIFVNVSSSDSTLHYTLLDFDHSLKLWLRMDDINSTNGVIDSSSYSTNASNSSRAFQNASGKFNASFTFDGNSSIISLPSYPLLRNEGEGFTASLWLNRQPSASGTVYVYEMGALAFAMTYEGSSIVCNLRNSTGNVYQTNAAFTPAVSTWYNVICSYSRNDNVLRLYVNGVVNTTLPIAAFDQFNGPPSDGMGIGCRSLSFCSAGNAWNGSLDEVIVFNRSLNNTEIGALYDATATQYTNNFTSLSAGDHTFTAYAVDMLGNKNQTEQTTVTITNPTNTAPSITSVQALAAQDPTEDSITNVIFNFTAYDPDGFGDLKDASARVNVTIIGQSNLRQNLSCAELNNFATNYANYTCSVQMQYFDSSGSWNLSVSINDTADAVAINESTYFTYNQLSAFTVGPSNLTFASLTPGSTNQTSNNDPLVLNNTGNKNVTLGNIQVNATNLKGETDNTKALYANNFTLSIVTGSSFECGISGNQSVAMSHWAFINVTNSSLTNGNHSLADGSTGQEQIYMCLTVVGNELSGQAYSTAGEGAWTLKILIVALGIRRRKKEIEAIEELKRKYSLTDEDLREILENRSSDKVPVTLFITELGGLESLCKYLKENRNMSYHEIAMQLERNDRTIWTSYKKASSKYTESIREDKEALQIPLSVFKNKELTVFESIIIYLKKQELTFSEIAQLLQRDQRNVWTIHSRAVRKIKRNV